MKMKKLLFIAIVTMFISCNKEEESIMPDSNSSVKNELKVYDFESNEKMFNMIDQIVLLKERKQQVVLNEFAIRNNSKLLSNKKAKKTDQNKNKEIILELKRYNVSLLNTIYELRKELGFTSIQSIADEINSLQLVNSIKADELEKKYTKFLIRNEFQVETIFDNRLANIVNVDGEVLVKGIKFEIDNKDSKISPTGKFIRYEADNMGTVAKSEDLNFTIIYKAGREVHENDLGFKFYRYYCSLAALYRIENPNRPNKYIVMPCPTTFDTNSSSLAGFAQEGSDFFSDYSFDYSYPSGYGAMVTKVGGKKNTKYVPVGGSVSGHFSTNTGGFYQELTADMTYVEQSN